MLLFMESIEFNYPFFIFGGGGGGGGGGVLACLFLTSEKLYFWQKALSH